jgi:hypothetical protein
MFEKLGCSSSGLLRLMSKRKKTAFRRVDAYPTCDQDRILIGHDLRKLLKLGKQPVAVAVRVIGEVDR